MSSWKTTIGLLFALAMSLGWVLRPIPEEAAAIPETPAAVTKNPEQVAHKHLVERKTAPRREHSLLRLQTTKSLEEQRLHDLTLFRLFQEHGRGVGWTSISRWNYPESMSELEILSKEREKRYQATHQRFLELEDYILNTDFTELTEEEQDDVYQFYEWRKRIDEAFANYFDTPVETWLELSRRDGELRNRCQKLLQRQYQHDAEGMSLEDALQKFFPHRGKSSLTTSWNGLRFKIGGYTPTSSGIAPKPPWPL